MSLETEFSTVVTTVEKDAKAVEGALTMDVGPAATKVKSSVGAFLTRRIDIFGATIPLNKKVTTKVLELLCVAALAVGLIGTQAYVYENHKQAIEDTQARTTSLESVTKQYDTDFVNVNSAITATNKVVASVQDTQKADEAKVAALAAQVSVLNNKLSPVRPTITRKYYPRRK
jgi:hypothetical protein